MQALVAICAALCGLAASPSIASDDRLRAFQDQYKATAVYDCKRLSADLAADAARLRGKVVGVYGRSVDILVEGSGRFQSAVFGEGEGERAREGCLFVVSDLQLAVTFPQWYLVVGEVLGHMDIEVQEAGPGRFTRRPVSVPQLKFLAMEACKTAECTENTPLR